jgi:hypothetical protein
MADYPLGCAIVLSCLIAFAWWQTRAVPARSAAALWTLAGAAISFAVAQAILAPDAQPSLRHVTLGPARLFHPASQQFPAPSGTAALAGATVIGLFLVGRRYGIAATVAAVLVAAFLIGYESYAASDVLAGGLLGFAIVLGGYVLLERPFNRIAGGFLDRVPAAPGAAASDGSHLPEVTGAVADGGPQVPPEDTEADG